MIKYLENNNLDELIGDGVYLVDFYADWCGPCKMLGSVLESMNINIIKVNTDKFPELATKFGVMSIPALYLFKDGKQVDNKVGFMPLSDLEEWINN